MARKNISASDLGLNLKGGRESSYFKWFLASFLFGKRISQETAKETFAVLDKAGINTPEKIIKAGWPRLVKKLDEGHYTRYDESTARYMLSFSEALRDKYDGKLKNVVKESGDRKDLEKKLLQFKGVGPKTVEIFMRDMAPVLYH